MVIMSVFGYLILIYINFWMLYSPSSPIDKVYHTLEIVFDQIFKHLEVRFK